jgi:hypothetical protein
MSNNVLTAKETYQLAQWVEEHRDEIEQDYRTYSFWIAIATGDLGFVITEANFATACRTVGLVWKDKKPSPDDDVRFLAKIVLCLASMYGDNAFRGDDFDRLRNLSHAKVITRDKTLFDGKE